MEVAKVTSKGQITIPISIRRKLEINEGDKILFIYKPDGVMMVNPNKMQGGYTGDMLEAEEAEAASEAAVAIKSKEPAKSAPDTSVQPAAAQPTAEDEYAPESVSAEEATVTEDPVQTAIPRPFPPPVEEPAKPDTHVGGFNLSTLLDDIRSIGSNI